MLNRPPIFTIHWKVLPEALDIFYFPSSFKNKKNYSILNQQSRHAPHRSIDKSCSTSPLSGGEGTGERSANKKIFVTYPEALFEKVIVPGRLSSNIIHIKVGDVLNTEELLCKAVNYGFERTDFVYEPGQFAIRGGILDIYSFGNDKPYRVELFGNDVDSIRIVDPETQLSERKLLQVSIIPNVDTQFENEERVSLLDFLPQNTVVWFQDHDWCKERLSDCEEDLDLFLQREANSEKDKTRLPAGRDNNDDRLIKKNVTADDFISAKEFEEKILDRHFVEFSYQPSSIGHHYEIEFNTKQQPAFNRQFDILIRDLKALGKKQVSTFSFCRKSETIRKTLQHFYRVKSGNKF